MSAFCTNSARTVYTSVKHAINGRIRLQVKGVRNSEPISLWLAFHLDKNSLIDSYRINKTTGNVTLHFEPTAESEPLHFVERKMQELMHMLLEKAEVGASEKQLEKVILENLNIDSHHLPNLKKETEDPLRIREFSRAKTIDHIPYTTKNSDEVLDHLKTDLIAGLSHKEAAIRLVDIGPNQAAIRQLPSPWHTFKPQLFNVPVGLLLGSSFLSLASGAVLDASMILLVVCANAAIGYKTERSAQRTILSIKNAKNRKKIHVIRGNKRHQLKPELLLPGDVILVGPGYVPADCRIMRNSNLTVDESKLTGESDPIRKTHRTLKHHSVSPSEHHNMLYQGTIVTGGHGLAVVTATAESTFSNRISALVDSLKIPKTPLQKDLEKLGTQSVAISSAICFGFLALGFLRGMNLKDILQTTIALGVAAVPEGLPAVGVSTLAIGVRRMRKHEVLVKRLPAVEALGGTDILCFDKTGTLTENSMVLKEVRTLSSNFLNKDSLRQSSQADQDIKQILMVMVLCSEATMKKKDGRIKISASATEQALLDTAKEMRILPYQIHIQFKEEWRISRNLEQPFLVTMHSQRGADVLDLNDPSSTPHPKGLIGVKGSPEHVLNLCNTVLLKDGSTVPLTEDYKKEILNSNRIMAAKALRVLGFAFAKSTNLQKRLPTNLTWIGLTGLEDPIRSGMRKTVRKLRRAGIRVCVLTGDQLETAQATVKPLNLKGKKTKANGVDASKMKDSEDLTSEITGADVFARISPSHKLQIVKAMQDQGHRVGMIGDGVNDGPALKASNVGIALGEGGTEAARHSSDIVIRDNNLETILKAIAQGRSIRSNLSKSMHYMMSTNLSELLLSFGGLAFGIGCPLSPMQLLWINLLTDVAPAIGLALEDPERDIMKTPPVPPNTPILNKGNWCGVSSEASIIALNALFDYLRVFKETGNAKEAESMSFLSLTATQLAHLAAVKMRYHEKLAVRSPSSLAVFGGGVILGLSFGLPWLRNWIGLSSHSVSSLTRTISGVAGVTLVNSILAAHSDVGTIQDTNDPGLPS